jgi:hypothetical protein
MPFRVRSWKAILFEKPSMGSKQIGEFRQGAPVRGVVVDYQWLLIESPDRGYLQIKDLESLTGKRRGR